MSARNCAHAREPTLDRAAFFVQQAAEKLVEAVLIGHGIGALARRVPDNYPGQKRLSDLDRFTDFVVAFSYPSEQGEEVFPAADEVEAWVTEIAALKTDFERWLGEREAAS